MFYEKFFKNKPMVSNRNDLPNSNWMEYHSWVWLSLYWAGNFNVRNIYTNQILYFIVYFSMLLKISRQVLKYLTISYGFWKLLFFPVVIFLLQPIMNNEIIVKTNENQIHKTKLWYASCGIFCILRVWFCSKLCFQSDIVTAGLKTTTWHIGHGV